MPVTLTSRERAHLKSRAHAMEPVVSVGKTGVTDAVIAEVERALTAHELIKVRAASQDRDADFFEHVALGIRVDEADRSYHVPLLLSPFGITTHRG